MTSKTMLVTGASSGIGRAIAIHFSRRDFDVFAVARRESKLAETKSKGNPSKIHCIVADVSTEDGRENIIKSLTKSGTVKISHLIQNAGVLGDIKRVEDVSLGAWRNSFAVNVEAPFFLTQAMLNHDLFDAGARILHMGSGAATQPMIGWSTYNISKAAFRMMYKVLELELQEKKVFVGSIRPGIVASEMQDEIRQARDEHFPQLQMFKDFKTNEYKADGGKSGGHTPPTNGLDSADNIAHFIDFLLSKVSDADYSKEEWDIRDTSHHSRWVQ